MFTGPAPRVENKAAKTVNTLAIVRRPKSAGDSKRAKTTETAKRPACVDT